MLRQKRKLKLRLINDIVYCPEYISVEEDKIITELLGDMIVSKSKSWCG